MTREEVIKVLAVLQTAYPMFYRNQNPEQTRNTVTLWSNMFKDKDFALVSAAVNALIATRTDNYPPSIGAVNAMVLTITEKELTPLEAWGHVRKAIRNGIYGAEDEWERLPDAVKEAISPSQIRAWASDEDFNEGVASSNFMKSFAARQKNSREYKMLPADIQNLMITTINNLALEG